MINQNLPQRIDRLDELANNLWWSWHEPARQLFRALDYPLWRISAHNPVKMLRETSLEALQTAANSRSFLSLYDSTMLAFDTDVKNSETWFSTNYPDLLHGPIAYFSMEYAIHNSLPIYAGGLGILAGDICKEASDLGIPLVAVGFMYPQGYFQQQCSLGSDSCQQEFYSELKFDEAPISQVFSPEGKTTIANVSLNNVTLAIGAWQLCVGRTNIYLLDTNLEENPAQYRELASRLYITDREIRIQQEIVLGIGGVRVLRALGINPAIWHANEGHTAFMMLERIREHVAEGKSFTEALNLVQAKTVFTTHTPVMAGHDIFSDSLTDKYFSSYWESLGIDRDTFFQFGQQDGLETKTFNMTSLALKTANQRSAVSRLHGKVTHRMWHGIWPEVSEDEVPITHVTNGIHVPTWIASEIVNLLDKHLGTGWIKKLDESILWERLRNIPDDELWAVRRQLKHKLASAIRDRMRNRWIDDNVPWRQMLAMGALLDPEALTIAFVRRFTEYKRPTLLFRDIERLKQIINDEFHPVQIVFAGKSHPADLASKQLIHQVYNIASQREFKGRIVFVEDYDMHIAHYLVQGVDVWLNTPRRLQEACGTSGMKATLNGALHLSVPDGWWYEGYNGNNGWVIGDYPDTYEASTEDRIDAEAIYRLLEENIVPLYYARDVNGVPHEWTQMVKESISSIVPAFCARRMMKEYTERMYVPAAHSLKCSYAVEAQGDRPLPGQPA
ncbi:alpha-glucan family phosphorylase [Chloroflexota bacterium]